MLENRDEKHYVIKQTYVMVKENIKVKVFLIDSKTNKFQEERFKHHESTNNIFKSHITILYQKKSILILV